MPEYAGSALEFFSLGRLSATSDAEAANRALAGSVAGRGLVAARPAPAQDANAIVVTAATAARYGLRSIADLARVAPGLVFGGPPECPGRAYCLPGLKRVYGLRFKTFIPLDAGGPLTLQALEAGYIGVALLFTTDPDIPARHLVVLADDRGLQPAENITPLVRRDVIARYGPHLLAALNTVSALLDTGTLRALDARVELAGQDPRLVAGSWLRAHGLIPAGRWRALSDDIERVAAAGRPGQRAAGPGRPQGPPSAPPDRRAAAAAAPVDRDHDGVAGPGGRGPGRRVPGRRSTRRGCGLMTGSAPGCCASWRGCGRHG